MPNVHEVKILIVEDDETTAAAVETYLQHDGFEVVVARTGAQAIDAAQRDRPHLVILDVMLPELGGIEVCRALREQSDVPIIMLTARTTESDKLEGLDAGADDYVTKPFSPRELVARVKSVLRRTHSAALREAGTFGNLVVDRKARAAFAGGTRIALTPTEFRLLEILSASPEVAFSRSDLVERVFGFDYDGMERTLDVHVRNLRKKLAQAGTGADRIRTVFGVGYAFAGSGDA